MEKHSAIVLSNQQRNEIVVLLDSSNPNKARHVANFLEKIEPQEVMLAESAEEEIQKLEEKIRELEDEDKKITVDSSKKK